MVLSARFYTVLSLFCAALCLVGCASETVRDRPGVKEAKACLKALKDRDPILERYLILSCTNNGVWVARDIQSNDQFDFVNKELTSAIDITTEFDDMDDPSRTKFSAIRKQINKELLVIYD